MAYPTQITTGAKLPEPVFDPGPHAYNGALYVTLHDRVNHHVEVWSALGDGQGTWSEQDAANHKSVRSAPAAEQVIDTFKSGDKLVILYTPGGGTTLNIVEFTMTSGGGGSWGTPITGGPAPEWSGSCMVLKRSDDSYVVFYTDLKAGKYRVSLRVYDGSWGSPVVVFDPGVTDTSSYNYLLVSAVMDDLDNIYILGNIVSGSFYRFAMYSAGNSLSAVQSINHTFPPFAPQLTYAGHGLLFTLAGDDLLLFPAFLNHSGGPPYYAVPAGIFAPMATAPTSWAAAAVADKALTDDGSTYSLAPYPSAVFLDPTVYLYYSWLAPSGQYKIRRTCSRIWWWESPSDVFVPTSGDVINYVHAKDVGGGSVGLVFSAQGTSGVYQYPHYYQETPPACPFPTSQGALYEIV